MITAIVSWMMLSQPLGVTTPERLEFAPYEPIELHATIEAPEGFRIVLYDWEADKPAHVREYNDGKSAHVWAPPGRHEIELEAILHNKETDDFRKEERFFNITIRGPPVNPVVVVPTDPIDPPQDLPTGPVTAVILAESSKLNDHQSGVLLAISDWADTTDDVFVFRFDPDSKHRSVKGYVEKLPADSKLPYCFLLKSSDDRSVIYWQGEVDRQEDIIAQIDRGRD